MNKNGKLKVRGQGRLRVIGLSLMFLFALVNTVLADEARDKIFAERTQAAWQSARSQFQSNTNDPVLAWQFARTCFDYADLSPEKRAIVAQEGIAACRHSLVLSNSTGAHYYLALNLGELAQTEDLGALKLVREMAREFQATAELDKNFDFAGPERGLGLLSRDAPDWPLSVGSRHKAREYLESATKLAPGDPENILNLAETYLKWGDRTEAKKELDVLEDLWPKAQKDFTGPAWEQSWDDWSKRRDVLREKLN